MQWEYRKILLSEHHRRADDLDLLCDAGERGWELVAITPNNVAYLKRAVRSPGREEVDQQQNHAAGMRPKYRNPATARPGRGAVEWQFGSRTSRMPVKR